MSEITFAWFWAPGHYSRCYPTMPMENVQRTPFPFSPFDFCQIWNTVFLCQWIGRSATHVLSTNRKYQGRRNTLGPTLCQDDTEMAPQNNHTTKQYHRGTLYHKIPVIFIELAWTILLQKKWTQCQMRCHTRLGYNQSGILYRNVAQTVQKYLAGTWE